MSIKYYLEWCVFLHNFFINLWLSLKGKTIRAYKRTGPYHHMRRGPISTRLYRYCKSADFILVNNLLLGFSYIVLACALFYSICKLEMFYSSELANFNRENNTVSKISSLINYISHFKTINVCYEWILHFWRERYFTPIKFAMFMFARLSLAILAGASNCWKILAK